jgi:hypothetical protein
VAVTLLIERIPTGRIERHKLQEWCESRGEPVTTG